MEWYWWVLIVFWTGGFGWAVDNVRTALRNRHTRKLELLEASKQERLAVEAANRPPEPVCGCTHHLAKHDKRGKCHERVEVPHGPGTRARSRSASKPGSATASSTWARSRSPRCTQKT